MDVLEDTLVAFRVPAWSGADRSSLVRHGKLFLFDLGVRNALLRRPLDRPLDDERGLLASRTLASLTSECYAEPKSGDSRIELSCPATASCTTHVAIAQPSLSTPA